jgi:uncharacterized protein YjcR
LQKRAKKVTGLLRKRLYKLLERRATQDKEIAKKLGISVQTVAIYKRKWGFFKRNHGKKIVKNKINTAEKKQPIVKKNNAGRPKMNGIIVIPRTVKRIIINIK